MSERHRHRYEVNNAYRDRIAESGLRFSGTSPDGHLVEFVEYAAEVHPFLVGTQAHPELKSRPTRPHPLFVAFIGAALDYKAAERLPVEIPEQHANGSEHPDDAAQPLPRRSGRTEAPWLNTTSTTVASETVYVGKIFALRADEVRMPGGSTARREVVEHFGAVAVVAIDDDDNVVHGLPVPAPGGPAAVGAARRAARRSGGEPPHLTAARELRRGGRPGRRELARAGRPGVLARVQRRERAGLPRHRPDRRRQARGRTTKRPT